MPKFSIIMPSYLGKYKHSASNPEEKFVRAVKSALTQEDFELVVIADGCDTTIALLKEHFADEIRKGVIRAFKISDDRKFGAKRNAGASGVPRNAGIQQAKGEYIVYLDHDDTYREDYLKDLKSEMTDHDWYWFDDLSWNKHTERFDKHLCDIAVQGQCGTSNLCHRRDLGVWWYKKANYLHDWMFVSSLKARTENYKKLDVVGYQICHVPNLLDV